MVVSSVPPRNSGLEDVVADIIPKNVISLVTMGTTLQLTGALGDIGSDVINQLVRSSMVRDEKDCVSRARPLDQIAQKIQTYRL